MTVIRGQATGEPRIAGRVNALAVDNTGTRIYAASGNGGIWYSSDGGAHWKSLGGFAPTNAPEVNRPAQRNSCGTIHVVFGATEADDDVFVGTGEAASQRVDLPRNAQPGISLGGIGILFAHGPAVAAANANPWRREAKNLIGSGVNRIAIGPDGTTVVAATSNGLFQRPSAPGVDVDWVRVAGAPFSSLTDECTDVLWTAGAGARPERLWVWVRQGDKAGLWVRSGTATNFKPVATPGSANRNAVLVASNPPDQIFLFNDLGGASLPTSTLSRIAAATAADPVATAVAGVPDVLQTQGFYDIALAIHPTLPDRVVLGGCTFSATTPDGTVVSDGAVVMGDIALVAGVLTFTNLKMISVGVHSDVHDVVYSNTGGRIWVSCDGGVYRSNNPTNQAGFFPCNDGLSIIEANYVANHSTCEGYIVTGLQDNGVIERLSNGVWRLVEGGDGGSVVFDPKQPTRFISQYVRGVWRASDGTFKWNSLNNLLNRAGTLASAENAASAFYSTAAGTKQIRGVNVVGQIIAGSTRVWYTENFGAPWPTAIGPRWVTLPTGTDPLPGNSPQDDFGEKITVCRWQSPDVAWILGEGKLMRYARTPGSDAAGGPGSWTRETIIKKNVKNKKDATSADGPIRDSSVWTDIAVNLDPPTVVDGPGQQHGAKGALYLGTIGNADDDDVDTLWWFDGTSKWFKTKLRKDEQGHPRVPAPVTAIVCDPVFPNEVYVGTTVGVWKGVRTQVGNADPTWAWEDRVNGLPEAAVEDLAIFSDGGLRLLRAAIAARGTWELRLDVADVVDLTYVRAHNDDLRYRVAPVDSTGKRVLKQRDLSTDRSWHGSPDVRPRLASRSVPFPAGSPTLTWQKSTFPPAFKESLRRFQAALRSKHNDPRVRPTGVWDSYFNEVLRDLGSPLLPAPAPPNTVCITKAFWDATMSVPADATAEPWGTGIPLEADLYNYAGDLTEGDANQVSCSMPRQKLKVDILVHHRGLDPVDGANVCVTLLWWADPKKKNAAKWNDATTWFAGNVAWTPAVNEVLNSADGKTTKVVDAGWKFAIGNNTQSHRVTLAGQTLDSTHSGVATFDLDVSPLKANAVVLLVAIIRAGTTPADDIALAPATLQDLALTSPNVAVRSMRISP
jgi:hypothetical protein